MPKFHHHIGLYLSFQYKLNNPLQEGKQYVSLKNIDLFIAVIAGKLLSGSDVFPLPITCEILTCDLSAILTTHSAFAGEHIRLFIL